MSVIKFQELKKSLQNTLAPIYIIRGKDAFLREKAEEMIVNAAVETMLELNTVRYTDETADIESILTACQSMPMMSDKKAVVLRDIVFKNTKDIQVIEEYCKSPVNTTCLIIVDSSSSSCYKGVLKFAELIDCAPLDTSMIQRIVVTQLSKQTVSIDIQALNLLLAYCNMDLMRITSESNKLAMYVGSGGAITTKDVENMVTKDVEYSIFELGDAVSKKDAKKAINIIKVLLLHKEQPQILMMMIQSSFRRMFYTVISKMTNKEIADYLGIKEYAVKISRETAGRFSPARLKNILDFGAELDYKVKSGQMNAENALYFYVTNITMR